MHKNNQPKQETHDVQTKRSNDLFSQRYWAT